MSCFPFILCAIRADLEMSSLNFSSNKVETYATDQCLGFGSLPSCGPYGWFEMRGFSNIKCYLIFYIPLTKPFLCSGNRWSRLSVSCSNLTASLGSRGQELWKTALASRLWSCFRLCSCVFLLSLRLSTCLGCVPSFSFFSHCCVPALSQLSVLPQKWVFFFVL
jgi:hypothetical protein